MRSVERRIAAIQLRQIEASKAAAGVRTTSRAFTDSAPIEIKMPEGDKRSEYMQVMCDLNVLAFQTDLTRVSTYIGSTPNGVSYPELGFPDEHHSVHPSQQRSGRRSTRSPRSTRSTSRSSRTWSSGCTACAKATAPCSTTAS